MVTAFMMLVWAGEFVCRSGGAERVAVFRVIVRVQEKQE